MITATSRSGLERFPRATLLVAAWLAGIAVADALAGRCAITCRQAGGNPSLLETLAAQGGGWLVLASLAGIGVLALTARAFRLPGRRGRYGSWAFQLSRRRGRHGSWAVMAGASTVAALLGAARFNASAPDLAPPHVAAWIGQTAAIEGRVADEAWVRDNRAQYRVDVNWLTPDGAGRRDAGLPVGGDQRASSPAGARFGAGPRRPGGDRRVARGRILVQAPAFPPLAYGELVRLRGPIEAPPELAGFDYAAYLARKDIHALVRVRQVDRLGPGPRNPVRAALLSVKARAKRALAASIPEPEASLATGILLGDARGIPEAVDEAFRATNTTHVIAISGSNVALVIAVATAVLAPRLGRRRAVPPALVFLAVYTALVGADAAVVRASVMGCVALLGIAARRPSEALAALAAAAFAMTAYRPSVLWDLGFQLSCAATLGLILFEPSVASALARLPVARARSRFGGLVMEGVAVTLAAQITTWPIIAHQVGQVSLTGLVANFLIVPAQPPVMALSAVTAALGVAWAPAGTLAGTLAWLPLAYTIRVVEALARAPGATISLSLSSVGVWLYFGALAMTVFFPATLRRSAWRESVPGLLRCAPLRTHARSGGVRGLVRSAPLLRYGQPGSRTLAAAAAACVLAWVAALWAPDGFLHVRVLSVGQGDAILIETPTGRRLLVDAGPGDRAVLDGLGRRGPPWARGLDGVLVTHPDADHVGGMAAVLQRHGVTNAIDTGAQGDAPEAVAYEAAIQAEATERRSVSAGTRIVLDGEAGVAADVIWPPAGVDQESPNNASAVLLVRYGAVRILLTGDIEAPVEEVLVRQAAPIAADVLKVAHHGSSTSTTVEFLRGVSPAAAVISVGADNRYGHPTDQVLRTLEGIDLWRTDLNGAVDFFTDGRSLWVRAERGGSSPWRRRLR